MLVMGLQQGGFGGWGDGAPAVSVRDVGCWMNEHLAPNLGVRMRRLFGVLQKKNVHR